MYTFFLIAYRNIFQAKKRTFLLGLAILIVSLLFITLRSAGESITRNMVDAATTLSSGHVNVSGFFKARKKGANPILSNRTKMKEFVARHVPEAELVIDRHRGWGRIVSNESSINSGLVGIEYDQEKRLFESLRIAQESEYKENGSQKTRGSFESLKNKNTVMLFSGQAKKLGVGVGDSITVVVEGAESQTNTADLTVGVIASDMGFLSNFSVFITREMVIDLYRSAEETTGAIMIYLKNIENAALVMERLREAAKKENFAVMDHDPNPFFMKFDKVMGEDWLGQKLDFTIWSDEVSFVVWITQAFNLVTGFVVMVLGIIIAGGIGNTMWMAVKERTKEIGTMRAIGAQKNRVLLLFVLEAVLIGVLFSFLGAVLGSFLVTTVNALDIPITNEGVRLFLMANVFHMDLTAAHFVSTLVLFSVITAIGALFPAIRAAKLRPIEALMHSK